MGRRPRMKEDGTDTLEDRWYGLMRAALDGDARAYRTLLGEVRTRLVRYVAARLSRQLVAQADDIVQETLLAIHARRLTYDRSQPVTPWIFAIARYKLIDHLRRHKARPTMPLDEDLAVFAADDEPATAARLDIETALSTIPARQRELIRAVKIEGAGIAEAAAAQGMSETAAKVSIHRTMKSLTAKFGGGGNER